MEKRHLGVFSGWQLTVLGLGAMLVPGALWGATTLTDVAISDPNTGRRAFVDDNHRLLVEDANLIPASQPQNFVNDSFGIPNGACTPVYQIPRGKALVITDVTMTVQPVTAGIPAIQEVFWGDDGFKCTRFVGGATTDGASRAQQIIDPLAPGAPVPAGSIINVAGANANGSGSFHGYLVPAAQVPAAGTAELAQLSGRLQAPPLSRAR